MALSYKMFGTQAVKVFAKNMKEMSDLVANSSNTKIESKCTCGSSMTIELCVRRCSENWVINIWFAWNAFPKFVQLIGCIEL